MSDALDAIAQQLAQGRHDEAAVALAQWLARAPADADALARAASLALALGRAPLALAVGEKFVARAPQFAGSHHAIALAHLLAGNPAAAEDALRRALALAPGTPMLELHLAITRLERGDARTAAAILDTVLSRSPGWPEARVQRAIARLRMHDAAGAREDFAWWTQAQPAHADAWRGLAEAAEMLGRVDEARNARAREIALDPDSTARRRENALALARLGDNLGARASLAQVLERSPRDLRARWAHWNLMPYTYADDAELAHWRSEWLEGLAAIEAIDPAQHAREELVDALLALPDFYVHYQGGDLLALQRRYGALVSRWARTAFPDAKSRAQPRTDGPLRIGFASAYLRNHTVWHLFGCWLARLDRTRFRVVAIHLGAIEDEVTASLAQLADEVLRAQPGPAAWVDALARADLDALIWLDIGMDGLTQGLAALRFAPVTAMAWGHPVTSGLDSVDHFLSAQSMEPAGADAHYAEHLQRLPGIGVDFARPAALLPRTPRDPARAPRLVCVQSVFKLVPANLALLARVARGLPEARIELVPHPVPAVREELAGRLRVAFHAEGVDFDERATVHPSMRRAQFLALLRDADVMLDTLGWSGGHTTLEALAQSLPVVAVAGEFMRARHTAAMLAQIGLDEELVARDVDHYVEIVTRLVRDEAHYARVVAAIADRADRLYADPSSTRALEEFLWRVCGRA